MPSGSRQLKKDFEQIQKLLKIYPNIKIIAAKGDPPEQYDIEYNIKGYRTTPDGSATPDDRHEVRITLPFGYPHFPPTVKPITPIFHPDIDPDAIRVADFWQQNHSLPDLVIHIGRMICGNHYTKDDPFNQNAFDWYEKRSSWLPFDILEPIDEDEAEQAEAAGIPPEAKGQQPKAPAAELDILKDDFDFPFDDEFGGKGEDQLFDMEEDAGAGDEAGFDLEVSEAGDMFDLGDEGDAGIPEDLFSLGTEEPEEEISFDLGLGAADEDAGEDAFKFELEEPAAEKKTPGEITLADLAGIEEEDEELDFGIPDELRDLDSETSIDLSGLEDEAVGFDIGEPEEAGAVEDEEHILSALNLEDATASRDTHGDRGHIIQSLIDQKQIFTAKKALADLADAGSPADRAALERAIATAINEAEDLYKKADAHEQKGEYEKAGILLDLVSNIAQDFPGLDFSRNRIRESIIAEGVIDSGAKKSAAETGKALPRKKIKPKTKLGREVPAKLAYALLLILVLGVAGGGAYFVYGNDARFIDFAGTHYQWAEQLVNSKDFTEGEKMLGSAREALDKIIFFNKSEKETLAGKINTLADSSLLKEGLKGRVLYDGKYYTVEVAKAIDKFNIHKNQAEAALQSGKVDQAADAYEKSLPYAETAEFHDQVETISRKIIDLRLGSALTKAGQHEEKQNWREAAAELQTAQDLSVNVLPPAEQNDISRRRITALYRYHMQEGLNAVNDSEWQKSIDAFQEVQKVIKENRGMLPAAEALEVDKLLVQSRLFLKLSEAKKAYDAQQWEEAIAIYRDAIALMENNSGLLGEEAGININKIKKTILTTNVSREQAGVASTEAENQLDKTADHYETIENLIQKSPFKDDEVFAEILEDAGKRKVEIREQLLVGAKEQWLKDNYEDIFRKHYPSASQSELSDLKVRYAKKEDGFLIFTMSCAEIKMGRSFRLELNYRNDPASDQWSLYSGTIEEEEGNR